MKIFGNENRLCQFIWKKDNDITRKNVKKALTLNEYILAYQKSDKTGKLTKPAALPSSMSNPDNDHRGDWFSGNISNPVDNPLSKNVYEKEIKGYTFYRRWFYDEAKLDQWIAEDKIYFPIKQDGTVGAPRLKMFADDFASKRNVVGNLIMDYSTTDGQDDFAALGLEEDFEYPKPIGLLKYLFDIVNNKDALNLDFFAGSGTTAHAVERLNEEDGGHRRWILITNNEDTEEDVGNPETGICRDITKPRIDTVITGLEQDGSKYSDGTNSGYQYFQYDFIKRDRNLYERNADRFFKPYIVDALITIKHGVTRTIQDGTRKLCVYESSTMKVVALFANTKPEDVQAIVVEHFADDEREHLLLLPEGTSAYKAILKTQVKNGIDVQYHHSLINTSDYLE